MMATIAMMRALHWDKPKQAASPRRKGAKAYRIVRTDVRLAADNGLKLDIARRVR
jgi:hypothetical protein